MRVLVDGINDNAEPRGPDRYLTGVLEPMARAAPESRFLLCLAPWQRAMARHPWPANVEIVTLEAPRNRWLRVGWHAVAFPLWANRQGADAVFAPNMILLPGLSAPLVMTVHDLAHFRFPEKFGAVKGRLQQIQLRLALKTPRRLIAVSDFTREDLSRFLGISGDRVAVIGEGGPEPIPRPPRAPGVPDFLYVGRIEHSKNVPALVDAFLASAALKAAGARLTIVGTPGNAEQDLARRIAEGGDPRVVRAGFVSEERLTELYLTCTAFVFPSLVEGFGLVLLEAMAHGAPVVAMRTGVMPEVVGDAGILVDPDDAPALTRAMERLAAEPALCEDLTRRGYARLGDFSWERAGADTLALIKEACA